MTIRMAKKTLTPQQLGLPFPEEMSWPLRGYYYILYVISGGNAYRLKKMWRLGDRIRGRR